MILREFNFKEKYPNIPEEKIIAIQRYYDTKTVNISSESAYKTNTQVLCAICSVLQEFEYIPFHDWDATVTASFLYSMESSGAYLTRTIPALKSILAEAGCVNDLSSINMTTIASEYCSSLLSFEILDTLIKRVFYEERPLYTWSKANSWTTGIVIYYLLWLGFTREDICDLKNSDFDEATCTIIYQGERYVKKRNITERINEATSEYIRSYFNSKSYATYTDDVGWRDIPYADGDTFIKLTSSKNGQMKEIVNNHIKKMHDYIGIRSSSILTAGRMDRMYYLNKIQNIPITVKNADIIAKDLNLSVPVKVKHGTEIKRLIMMYNSYKTKREKLYKDI